MGLRQQLKMDKFDWCITIYYTVDSAQKKEIIGELKEMGCDKQTLDSITKTLKRLVKILALHTLTMRDNAPL